MPTKTIQTEHHMARHCSQKDFADGEGMTELSPATFEPEEDDPDISVNWLEYYDGNFDTRVDLICSDMAAERAVRSRHKLALLQVDEIHSIGADCGHELVVVSNPRTNNDSHALIKGIPLDGSILHRELADAASQNLHPVVPYEKRSED